MIRPFGSRNRILEPRPSGPLQRRVRADSFAGIVVNPFQLRRQMEGGASRCGLTRARLCVGSKKCVAPLFCCDGVDDEKIRVLVIAGQTRTVHTNTKRLMLLAALGGCIMRASSPSSRHPEQLFLLVFRKEKDLEFSRSFRLESCQLNWRPRFNLS